MDYAAGTNWPRLEGGYTDEFGEINSKVYLAAGELFPWAENFTRAKLGNQAEVRQLLLKAAALVSRKLASQPDEIIHLNAYIAVTFKRLVLAELEKVNGHHEIEREHSVESPDLTPGIERKILIQQIIQQMDGWTRTVFELSALGYTYEEIAPMVGMRANLVRAKYSKQLKRISRKITP